jgi:hypothetical protein
MWVRSVIALAFLLVAAPTAAQYWCSGDDGVLGPATTFVATDACPSSPGDRLKLFRWSQLATGVWTTPFQLPTSSDFVTVKDSTGSTIFSLGEDVGLEISPHLTISNSEFNASQIFGHFAAPGSLPLPGGSCRAGSLATAGATPLLYICEGGTTWEPVGAFDFTGTIQWDDFGDSFQLNNSFGQPVFGLTSSSVEIGKPLEVGAILSQSASGSSITMSSFVTIIGVGGVRVGLGGNPYVELATTHIEFGFSGGAQRFYGARSSTPTCSPALIGSRYFDTDSEVQCLCKTAGWDPAGSCT